jgi:ketosteroid isomerase-like protein
MDPNIPENLIRFIDQLAKAGNRHDLPALTSHFAVDYRSQPPNHPERAFQGRAQVEKNWSTMFMEIPDFRMEVLDLAVHGSQVWTEWRWTGTLQDGSLFNWRGVIIFTVEANEISAARLYMEPVQEAGPDIDATVKEMTKG